MGASTSSLSMMFLSIKFAQVDGVNEIWCKILSRFILEINTSDSVPMSVASN